MEIVEPGVSPLLARQGIDRPDKRSHTANLSCSSSCHPRCTTPATNGFHVMGGATSLPRHEDSWGKPTFQSSYRLTVYVPVPQSLGGGMASQPDHSGSSASPRTTGGEGGWSCLTSLLETGARCLEIGTVQLPANVACQGRATLVSRSAKGLCTPDWQSPTSINIDGLVESWTWTMGRAAGHGVGYIHHRGSLNMTDYHQGRVGAVLRLKPSLLRLKQSMS